MSIKLLPHQEVAVIQLKTGSILWGGVGSGKTLTSLSYYATKVLPTGKKLYVITTAKKRDTEDWTEEARMLGLSIEAVDSWNNIAKYTELANAFFIFDEQRLVGSGAWVKSFLKIAKKNDWILLSATPGDTWLDYIPVFIANGFYKNRTEFLRNHVVYNTFVKFPKVDRYVETGKLIRLRNQILVRMNYKHQVVKHNLDINVPHNIEMYEKAAKYRWNPFTDKPIKDISEYCTTVRKIVNTDPSRLNAIRDLVPKHRRIIVFYNFDYELDILRSLRDEGFIVGELNGHRHDPLPTEESWIYLVQYLAGAEGWNCVETNVVVFYSLHYSYRIMTQAAGRINRLNSPFANLYYYYIRSASSIDRAIGDALQKKKTFNEKKYTLAQKK